MFSPATKLSLLLSLWLSLCGLTLATAFSNRVWLNPQFLLCWDMVAGKDVIRFRVIVRTTGWVGIGISPTGGMDQADIVLGWVSEGKPYFHDRHAVGNTVPRIDRSQDAILNFLTENGTHTIMDFQRSLVNCDPEDVGITDGTVKIIYASGKEDPTDIYTVPKHTDVYGARSLQLLKHSPKEDNQAENNTLIVDFTTSNFSVPDDTFYSCEVRKFPGLTKKHHMYKVEPVLSTEDGGLIHHMLLYICADYFNDSYIQGPENCFGKFQFTSYCMEIFCGWAIGGQDFIFPNNSGFSVGQPKDPKYYMLQIHYNNFGRKKDILDNSGFRLYFTEDLREYDAAILWIGILPNPIQIIPPHAQAFKMYGYCDSGLLTKSNTTRVHEIHVFAALLHTHLAGRKIRVLQFREGKLLRTISEDKYYDFNLQENRQLKAPVKIQLGDEIVIECTYNTEDKDGLTFGGPSTKEEMCLAFLTYYPKQELSTCLSIDSVSTVASALNISASSYMELVQKASVVQWNNSSMADYEQKMRDVNHFLFIPGKDEQSKSFGHIPSIPEESPGDCDRNVLGGADFPQCSPFLTALLTLIFLAGTNTH